MKKVSISRIVFCLLFSFSLLFMSKIHFTGFVRDKLNYIDSISFIEILLICFIVFPILYFLFYLVEKLYFKIDVSKLFVEKVEKNIKVKCIIFNTIFLFVIYMIYYLAFYPGGVFTDTVQSLVKIIKPNIMSSNQQPLLYTLTMYIIKIFEPNEMLGFAVHTFLQIILTIVVFDYFISWLLNKRVNPKIVIICSIFFGLFNIYPLYSVSIWKDTLFGLMFLLLVLLMIDIYLDIIENKFHSKNIVKLFLYSFIIIFSRSNGLLIVICNFIFLFLGIFVLKKKKVFNLKIKQFVISSIIIIMVAFIYNYLYAVTSNDPVLETGLFSIPIQQVAYVVNNGNYNEEEKEQIEKIIPIENIIDDFSPMISDSILDDSEFNDKYLLENKKEYFALWLKLFLKNPKEYVEEYLLQTAGFWSLNISGEEGYHSAITWNTIKDSYPQKNIIKDKIGLDTQKILLPKVFISGGVFFFIMAFSFYFTAKNKHKRFLLGYMVPFVLWASIMISTPIAVSLRYVYSLVCLVPLFVIYPFITRMMDNDS